jgi:ribosomal-protein-alanine N-acetyltransferase
MPIAKGSLDFTRFFKTHPTLETVQLLLRPRKLEDRFDIFEYASDPEVPKHMPWSVHQSIEETTEFLLRSLKADDRSSLSFSIELKSENKVIGDCGYLRFSPSNHSVELGCVLNRTYWGRGLMNEAIRELLRFAYDEMRVHRIEAHCEVENERSARLLNRLGFTLEGVCRDYELRKGRFIDMKIFSLLELEWREQLRPHLFGN